MNTFWFSTDVINTFNFIYEYSHLYLLFHNRYLCESKYLCIVYDLLNNYCSSKMGLFCEIKIVEDTKNNKNWLCVCNSIIIVLLNFHWLVHTNYTAIFLNQHLYGFAFPLKFLMNCHPENNCSSDTFLVNENFKKTNLIKGFKKELFEFIEHFTLNLMFLLALSWFSNLNM